MGESFDRWLCIYNLFVCYSFIVYYDVVISDPLRKKKILCLYVIYYSICLVNSIDSVGLRDFYF